MAWISLTADDVLNSLTAAEQSQMTDPSSAADLATIVASVVNMIRGKVNSYQPNQGWAGPAGTIPDETYAAGIAICRFKFLTHLPGTQLITQDRRDDKNEAYAFLDLVAKGDMIVAAPNGSFPQNEADTGGEPYFPPYPVYIPPQRPWGYW